MKAFHVTGIENMSVVFLSIYTPVIGRRAEIKDEFHWLIFKSEIDRVVTIGRTMSISLTSFVAFRGYRSVYHRSACIL